MLCFNYVQNTLSRFVEFLQILNIWGPRMKNIANETEKKLEINTNYIFQLAIVNFKHFKTFLNHNAVPLFPSYFPSTCWFILTI